MHFNRLSHIMSPANAVSGRLIGDRLIRDSQLPAAPDPGRPLIRDSELPAASIGHGRASATSRGNPGVCRTERVLLFERMRPAPGYAPADPERGHTRNEPTEKRIP